MSDLVDLHENPQRCAEVAGLSYVEAEQDGLTRRRVGTGFSVAHGGVTVTDRAVKQRIAALAIPPAWQQVWICPSPDGHILATGQDERGRKQYIYHPRWRAMRDLLNFYRLLLFAEHLPAIRTHVDAQLRRRTLDRPRVIAAMIAILDESLVRIGNEVYAEENSSYGLSTLGREHVSVTPAGVTFAFPGKSGKVWDSTVTDRRVAGVVAALAAQPGERLFSVDGEPVDSDDVNATLLKICGEHITAKNFRTWGGTLAAFTYLREHRASTRPAAKVAVEAIDEAADELGNTRSVARSHYVHPHVLETFTEHTFEDYLAASKPVRAAHLDPTERALVGFLTVLFEHEFTLLEKETP